ncbi:hypothetical protein Tcan_09009 [Toxocara canis]|uniref:Uncharacterized protein n=1 Tax=Toxocara canis TaxID=6265 RepID=A0A0B2VLB0_TOXCA|nr:hypothetical protein Tcan_09009 [Toxocara canis]
MTIFAAQYTAKSRRHITNRNLSCAKFKCSRLNMCCLHYIAQLQTTTGADDVSCAHLARRQALAVPVCRIARIVSTRLRDAQRDASECNETHITNARIDRLGAPSAYVAAAKPDSVRSGDESWLQPKSAAASGSPPQVCI